MLWRLKIHTCLQKRSAPIPVLGACHLLYVDGVPVNVRSSPPNPVQARYIPSARTAARPVADGVGLWFSHRFQFIQPLSPARAGLAPAPLPEPNVERATSTHSVEVSVDVGSRNMQVLYIMYYIYLYMDCKCIVMPYSDVSIKLSYRNGLSKERSCQ